MMSSRMQACVMALAAFTAACVSTRGVDPRLETARAQVARIQTEAAAAPDAASAAQSALGRAEETWRRRDLDAFDHEIRIVDGNVRLVEAAAAAQRAQDALAAARTRRTQAEVALARKGALSAQAQAAAERARAAAAEEQLASAQQQVSTAQQQAAAAQAEADSLREALSTFQSRETDQGTLINLSGLMFATGSAQLRPGAEQRLQPLARYLARSGARRVRIEGHTDSVGSASSNLALSKARADAVADYLSSQGVDRALIETRGLGETKPVAANTTNSGREENRRVEVTILR